MTLADDTIAVWAHGLVNAMRDLDRGVDALLSRGTDLSPDTRRRALLLISARARLVTDVLTDTILGSNPDLVASLDRLHRPPVPERHDDRDRSTN